MREHPEGDSSTRRQDHVTWRSAANLDLGAGSGIKKQVDTAEWLRRSDENVGMTTCRKSEMSAASTGLQAAKGSD